MSRTSTVRTVLLRPPVQALLRVPAASVVPAAGAAVVDAAAVRAVALLGMAVTATSNRYLQYRRGRA